MEMEKKRGPFYFFRPAWPIVGEGRGKKPARHTPLTCSSSATPTVEEGSVLAIALSYGIRPPLLTRSLPMLSPEAPTSLAQECNDPVSTFNVHDHDLEFDPPPLRTAVQVL